MALSILFLFITIQIAISSGEVTESDISSLATANNNLATKLYPKLINGNSNNTFFVPLSVMTGLGIMLYGAKGKTQEELYSVLGYKEANLPIERIPATYHYYLTQQLPQNNPHFLYYSLLCADEVLITNRARLNRQFQRDAQNAYLSTIENVNFHNNAKVTRDINKFVKKHTYGKINHMIHPHNRVDRSSSALLVDAVFFKGKWEKPFPPLWTGPQTFYSQQGQKDVPFMMVIGSFRYYENDDYQAVFLPYVGGFLGLLVLLPTDQNGLPNLEKTMTPENILTTLNQAKTEEGIWVLLPRFKFQHYHDFSKDMKDLGAESAYSSSADFSGMTNSKNLNVTGTLYKGAFEVDESNQGNGMSVNFSPPPKKLFLPYHPFMFAVVDIRYNLILAMGRVNNV